jgi:predicted ATPase/class 3 adenylate cyclase
MTALPSGTVTFLFSDIEGSTRLWEEHPDAMRGCLARHDGIMRTAITAHGGVIVKTTGDGVHAAFPTAVSSVAAAVDAQRAITTSSWDAIGGLRIRIGLHTGEAEVRDGDYYGSALNRAARLMSVAHGDQIVVSQVTEDLVRDSMPDGAELIDLGEHRLRDLTSPLHVFQVVHPDLPLEFPPLRSLESDRGNLPLQATSFVGRDDDAAALVAVLDAGPLVTLTGTGGVGKTRLAIQVAAEVVPRFADGAWFCELAAAADGELMDQVVANTIGCAQRPGLSLTESIVAFLQVRTLLLVLDNCEHLLDDAGDLAAAILRSCPGVTLLATSREPLDVDGERVVRVRSLAAPPPDATRSDVVESAAVRLFADRALVAGAATGWDDAQWLAVAEICRRVDGIPLAIELAAARVGAMTPAEIAAHLDERFRLLTGSRRGRVERHQTLRATVEWSYQLLDGTERAVFDRLGVFAGSFDAAGAVAVVSADDLDPWQVTDAVAGLVAKSMLATEPGPGGTTRYSMLETLRAFAREQLDQTGDADQWRRRHAQHFAAFAEEASAGLRGADDVIWLERAFAELDNVRAAIAWGLDRDDPDDTRCAIRIVVALEQFGQQNRTAGIDSVSVRMVDAFGDDLDPVSRSIMFAAAAYHEINRGDPDRARVYAAESLRDGVLADSPFPYLPHENLAFTELMTGRYVEALAALDEASEAFARIDNAWAEAHFLTTASVFHSLAGMYAEAQAEGERVLATARRLGNRSLLLEALNCLAWAEQRSDPEAALRYLDEYLALAGERMHHGHSGSALALAGGLRARAGDTERALELLHRAAVITRDDGVRPQVAAVLDWSLVALSSAGRAEVAATFLGALTAGPLADVSNYPPAGRRRDALERVRAELGDEVLDTCVATGAAMTYEEIAAYAIEHLAPEPT